MTSEQYEKIKAMIASGKTARFATAKLGVPYYTFMGRKKRDNAGKTAFVSMDVKPKKTFTKAKYRYCEKPPVVMTSTAIHVTPLLAYLRTLGLTPAEIALAALETR